MKMIKISGLFFLILLSVNLYGKGILEIQELKKNYMRFQPTPYLEGNLYTKERESLGKSLFFDPRLSGSNMISCASCHNPSFTWSDGLEKAVGHGHKTLGRRTPSILNLAWTEKMMWDGRLSNLEGQALGPIESEGEMNMPLTVLSEKVKNIKGYRNLFSKAYPQEEITSTLIAKAIAVYERGLVSEEGPFDKWIKGDEKSITEEAKKGFMIFNTKANCASCHSGWRFTDDSFHDIGLKSTDIGRGKFLKLQSQQFAFKTPGLRNIAIRSPYMHDGSEKDLKDVIELYNRGGDVKRDSLSTMIKPLNLTEVEKAQLLAFLETLTSKDKPVFLPMLPK